MSTTTSLGHDNVDLAADHDHHDSVDVIVDGIPKRIARGQYLVAQLKSLLDVDANKELEQIVEGRLVPLSDDATVDISRSGLRFVSHVRRGGSS